MLPAAAPHTAHVGSLRRGVPAPSRDLDSWRSNGCRQCVAARAAAPLSLPADASLLAVTLAAGPRRPSTNPPHQGQQQQQQHSQPPPQQQQAPTLNGYGSTGSAQQVLESVQLSGVHSAPAMAGQPASGLGPLIDPGAGAEAPRPAVPFPLPAQSSSTSLLNPAPSAGTSLAAPARAFPTADQLGPRPSRVRANLDGPTAGTSMISPGAQGSPTAATAVTGAGGASFAAAGGPRRRLRRKVGELDVTLPLPPSLAPHSRGQQPVQARGPGQGRAQGRSGAGQSGAQAFAHQQPQQGRQRGEGEALSQGIARGGQAGPGPGSLAAAAAGPQALLSWGSDDAARRLAWHRREQHQLQQQQQQALQEDQRAHRGTAGQAEHATGSGSGAGASRPLSEAMWAARPLSLAAPAADNGTTSPSADADSVAAGTAASRTQAPNQSGDRQSSSNPSSSSSTSSPTSTLLQQDVYALVSAMTRSALAAPQARPGTSMPTSPSPSSSLSSPLSASAGHVVSAWQQLAVSDPMQLLRLLRGEAAGAGGKGLHGGRAAGRRDADRRAVEQLLAALDDVPDAAASSTSSSSSSSSSTGGSTSTRSLEGRAGAVGTGGRSSAAAGVEAWVAAAAAAGGSSVDPLSSAELMYVFGLPPTVVAPASPINPQPSSSPKQPQQQRHEEQVALLQSPAHTPAADPIDPLQAHLLAVQFGLASPLPTPPATLLPPGSAPTDGTPQPTAQEQQQQLQQQEPLVLLGPLSCARDQQQHAHAAVGLTLASHPGLVFAAAGLRLPSWAAGLLQQQEAAGRLAAVGPRHVLDPALEWAVGLLSHAATPAEPPPRMLLQANRTLAAHLGTYRSTQEQGGGEAEAQEQEQQEERQQEQQQHQRPLVLPWPLLLPLLGAMGDRLTPSTALTMLRVVSAQVGPRWRSDLPPRQQPHLLATLRALFAVALRRPDELAPATAAGLMATLARLQLRSPPACVALLQRIRAAAAAPPPPSPSMDAASAPQEPQQAPIQEEAQGQQQQQQPEQGAPLSRRAAAAGQRPLSALRPIRLQWAVAALWSLVRLGVLPDQLPRGAVRELVWSLFASSDSWTPRLAASLPSWLAALRLRPSARLLREYRRALTAQRREQARRSEGQDGAGTGSSSSSSGSSVSTSLLLDMSAVQLCEVLDGLGAAVGGGVGVWAPRREPPPSSSTRDNAGHVPQGQGQGQHADAAVAAVKLLAREYGPLAHAALSQLAPRLREVPHQALCRLPLRLRQLRLREGLQPEWRQAFAAAARHVLPSCDATDCMLLMRGLAAVAAEVAEAAQAGARASPDAGEQAGQAAARLAHAQGQGPVAGKGQEASPLLPLLPEERELLVAVLRRFTELAGSRQSEAHLARPWRGPFGAGAPQLYHTVSMLESLAALHTLNLSNMTPTAPSQQQQSRKAARVARAAAASGEQHPASSGGAPAGGAGAAGGHVGVEAELLLRRATDLHHELQFLMQQAEDHAAACLAAALAEAAAAEAAAEAAARGRGRRGGGNGGSGGRAAAVTAAQLAVRALVAAAQMGRRPPPALQRAAEAALVGAGGALGTAQWRRAREALRRLGVAPGPRLSVALLTFV